MTAFHTRLSTTRLSGVLSGAGADMLRATVYTGALPAQPPPGLADFVHPVYDNRSELRDWSLGSLLPGRHIDDDAHLRFRQWRATFAQDRFLGERALVRSVLDWLEPRCDTSALAVLRLGSGRADFHSALKMRLQIEAADRVIADSHATGLGLHTATTTRSAMRVLIPSDPPTLLLADEHCALTIDSRGLRLDTPDPTTTLDGINGWQATELGVVAACDGRQVDLPEHQGGMLLRVAGRRAPLIDVHESPLRTLLSPLLVFLRDTATLAGRTHADLHFRSGWS